MIHTRRRIWRGDNGQQTEPGKGRRRATTRLNPDQMKSWSINGPASAAVILTNMMGHLWHEGAPIHHNKPPKTSEYGYSSVRRGKPPSHTSLLRESNGYGTDQTSLRLQAFKRAKEHCKGPIKGRKINVKRVQLLETHETFLLKLLIFILSNTSFSCCYMFNVHSSPILCLHLNNLFRVSVCSRPNNCHLISALIR